MERHHRCPTSRLHAASASAWQQQGEVWRCPGTLTLIVVRLTQVRIALIVANRSCDEVIIHKVTDDVGADNILHIHQRQCVQTTSDIVRLRAPPSLNFRRS